MTNRMRIHRLLVPLLLWALTVGISANDIDRGEFRSRRQAYVARAADGVTVLFNALEEDLREFAADKNFYYLTGAAIPDAILVLSPAHSQHKETLFIPERDLAQEKWTGPKLAPGAETAKQLGVDRVLGLDQFQSELTALMSDQRKLYTVLPSHKGTTPPSTQEGYVSRLKALFPFAEVASAATPIAHLRMTKSAAELSLLKRAIQITLTAHRSASRASSGWPSRVRGRGCAGV